MPHVIDVVSSLEDGKVETTCSSMEQRQDRSSESRSLDSIFFVPISLRQIKREIFTTVDHEIQNDALNLFPTELNNAVESVRNVREEEIKDEPTSYKELESDYVDNIKKENSDVNYVNNETLAVEDNVIYQEREKVASLDVDVRIEEMKTETEEVDDEESGAAPTERCKETLAAEIQDGGTLTPGGKNTKEPRTRGLEATSRNNGPFVSQSATTANNSTSINAFVSADTAIDNSNARVSDNECTHTHVGKNTRSRRRAMFSRTGVENERTETRGGQNVLECQVCGGQFSQKRYLQTHLRIHNREKPYECDICQVRFTRKDHLKRHLRVHTGEKPYQCEICKVRFNQTASLNNHLRIHTGEKPYKCDICKVTFNRRGDLNVHLRTHTGEKPYKCEICKVRFNRKVHLKAHLSIHTGEKPYECEICRVRFTRKDHLKRHLRIHTGEKPYKCEICKDIFKWKNDLNVHLRTHTGKKPYECRICKVRFNQSGNLKNHLRIHTGEKPYECEICKLRFSRKGILQKHLSIHTKAESY